MLDELKNKTPKIMWYNYIYLNPFKKAKYYLPNFDLYLKYEPIYIGKGKNERYLAHLKMKENSGNLLKCRTIQKILNNISLYDYIKNYIIVFNNQDDESKVLYAEKYLIEWFGTKLQVYGVPTRGCLTNFLRGGVSNPILFGAQNGFFGKHHTEEVISRIKELNKNQISWVKTLNDDEYQEHCHKISIGRKRCFENNPELGKKYSTYLVKYWQKLKSTDFELYKKKHKEIGEKFHQYRIINPLPADVKRTISEKSKLRWSLLDVDSYNEICQKRKDFWATNRNNNTDWYIKQCEKRKDFWATNKDNNTDWYIRQCEKIKERNEFNILKKKLDSNEFDEYCRSKRGGNKNGMYGKGYLKEGKNNGRSKCYYIKTNNDVEYIVWGSMKKFIRMIKNEFKLKNPGKKNLKPNPFLRCYDETYLKSINWIIKEIDSKDIEKNYKGIQYYEG